MGKNGYKQTCNYRTLASSTHTVSTSGFPPNFLWNPKILHEDHDWYSSAIKKTSGCSLASELPRSSFEKEVINDLQLWFSSAGYNRVVVQRPAQRNEQNQMQNSQQKFAQIVSLSGYNPQSITAVWKPSPVASLPAGIVMEEGSQCPDNNPTLNPKLTLEGSI